MTQSQNVVPGDENTGATTDDSAGPNVSQPHSVPREILNSIGEVIYDWDLMSDKLIWGPNVHELLNVFERGMLESGRGYAGLLTWDSIATRYDAVCRAAELDGGNGARYHAEYGLNLDPESRNSPQVWIEDTGRCFAGPDGKPLRAHGAIRIIEKSLSARTGRTVVSRLDALTGALDRAELTQSANRYFEGIRPGKPGFAMLLIAIDGLAAINRNYGYDVGDAVIAATARRIRELLRAQDVIARYAGNRFAILLHNCDFDQIEQAAGRFMQGISGRPLETPQGSHGISIRVGGVCAPRDARNTQQLFQHGEEASEAARHHASRLVIYSPSLTADHERLRNRAVAEQIVEALNQRKVRIALQPIVAARSGKPVFYEALMRMRLDDGRELAPASIIPIAEKTGLITLLDQRVTDLAIDQLVADPKLTLSVNISGITAQDPQWLAFARSKLEMHPGVASRMIVELTETCAIGDIDVMRDIFSQIRSTGMRVAMDDFGAGYSSFKNLRGLGIDLLKIDGAFVQNLARSADDRFFVRTLIDLAGHLQIPTVAEWVENQETATLLAEWGVDYCQGSWFGMGREENATPPAAGSTFRAA